MLERMLKALKDNFITRFDHHIIYRGNGEHQFCLKFESIRDKKLPAGPSTFFATLVRPKNHVLSNNTQQAFNYLRLSTCGPTAGAG